MDEHDLDPILSGTGLMTAARLRPIPGSLPPLKLWKEPITLSVTEIETWKRCRRQWALGSYNQQSLQRLNPKPALDFGGLWHKGAETWTRDWYQGKTKRTFKDHILRAANKEFERIRAIYLQQVGVPMDDAEFDPLYQVLATGLTMADNYQLHWGSPLPDSVELVEAEQKILTPIPGTRHCACHLKIATPPFEGFHCPCVNHNCDYDVERWEARDCSLMAPICCEACSDFIYLESKLDGIVRGKKSGRYFVLERKTYGQRPRIDTLESNNQFLHYIWVLEVLTGDCGGLFYDGAFKTDSAKYALEEKFLRTTLTRSQEELFELQHFLPQIALEMVNPNLCLFTNRRWEGCWDCDFNDLCTAISRQEDYQDLLSYKYTVRIPE